MSRRIWIGFGLVVLFSLNTIVVLKVSRGDDPRAAARATKTQQLSDSLRATPKLLTDNYLGRIGALVETGFWTGILPLAKEQAEAISKLDDLAYDARNNSYLADADYLDGNPADYQEYVARGYARRTESIKHARGMVALGLLTEPQANFVTQRYLSIRRESHSLGDEEVQKLLGMTDDQKMELAEVWQEGRSREARLNLFSVDPQEGRENSAKMAANQQAVDAAAMEILTPDQRKIWDQLTAKRTLPAEPPDLPVLTAAEAARIKIEELSPTFRVLAEKAKALELSDEQTRLLKDLKEVTQLGLFWIGRRDGKAPFPPGIAEDEQSDPVAQTRDEFLQHAEQVVLRGILTQQQAEEVEEAVKEN